jgi:tRNA threonylcarbamoyladenosine biosynthesis protein TsaB
MLALDTATPVLSAALCAGESSWYRELDAGLTHSEALMALVEGLFADAGLKPGDLGAVACMKGPGSFTGLRIGFAAAKGLALALDIPLLACPTLDCMAWPWKPWPGLVVPVLDARKNRFYSALYAGGRRISPEMDVGAAGLLQSIRDGIREAEAAGRYAGPVLLTGPDAGLFLSRLEGLPEGPAEGPPGGPPHPTLLLDPLCRKGRGLELLAVAKDRDIVNNDKRNDVMSGPEYIRKSTEQ